MSEKNRFPNTDVVRRLAENVVHGAETAAATSKDVADLALGAGKDVASSAANQYIRATLRTIELGSAAIKGIGKQVPLLPDEVKERFFGIDEPSLGDRPNSSTKE